MLESTPNQPLLCLCLMLGVKISVEGSLFPLLQPQDELSVRISSGRVKKGHGEQDLREWHENVSGKVKEGC